MLAHVVRRLLLAIPLVLGVVTLTFLLIELAPGSSCDLLCSESMRQDTCDALRARWNCGDPWFARYTAAMRNILVFDFGDSTAEHRPVIGMIGEALPNTLVLSLVTIGFAQLVGISVGVLQAMRQHSWVDGLLSVVTLTFYSMPAFWLAIVLLVVFTVWWPILPSYGTEGAMAQYLSGPERLLDRVLHLVLPGMAMGVATAAGDARYMRSSMLEVLHQDFVRTARAKGLPEGKVVLKHALRNALLPTITILGLNLPYLFGGALLVETVFSYQGMGLATFTAIQKQDAPMVMACFYFFAILVALGGILSDILYAAVDPRIRYR